MTTQVVTERIDEGAVGSLAGEPVAAASGCVAEYGLPDGSVCTGPSMLLCLLSGEEDRRVGVGSQLEVRGVLWTVATLRLAEGGTGHVELSGTVRVPKIPAKPEDLDFLFRGSCGRCGGKTGWDGLTSIEMGKLCVGMRCIRCPAKEWKRNGRILRMFNEGTPTFTPGRME
jgi:hypothetical protein